MIDNYFSCFFLFFLVFSLQTWKPKSESGLNDLDILKKKKKKSQRGEKEVKTKKRKGKKKKILGGNWFCNRGEKRGARRTGRKRLF